MNRVLPQSRVLANEGFASIAILIKLDAESSRESSWMLPVQSMLQGKCSARERVWHQESCAKGEAKETCRPDQ